MNKYRAKKTKIDGYTFDSKAESKFYLQLKDDPNIDQDSLEIHPSFDIVINNVKVCKVILDFAFRKKLLTGKLSSVIYVDVKGRDLPISRLKRKLLKAVHDVDVVIVPAKSLR